MNQKTVLCCFPYFRIKSKTSYLVDFDKTKTQDYGYFLLFFFHFRLQLRFSSHHAHKKHGIVNSNMHFKHIFIVFINFVFNKMVL